MGTYCLMSVIPQCRDEKLADLRQAVKDADDFILKGVYFDGLEIDAKGYIGYDDYYAKWKDTHTFAKFLAPFVIEGRLIFTANDNERWGYEFDGNGKVYFLEFEIRRGDKLT